MSDCVLFDLDGTLVDSERISARAFQLLLPGLPLSVEQFVARHAGEKLADVVTSLTAQMGVPADADFIPRFRAVAADLFRSDLKAFEGVAEALSRLSMPIAVASNAPREKIGLALEVTGLDRFFGAQIYSAYTVGRWKPDPALFLHAAQSLGVTPAACTVVEDSAPGMAAGEAAGMRVLQFYNDPTRAPDAKGFGRYSDLPGLLGIVGSE